jgi:hypothetical protein
MENESNPTETTSRRQFTRTIVTAAVAAPIAASLAACRPEPSPPGTTPPGSPTQPGTPSASATTTPTQTSGPCPCTATPHNGYTEISFGSAGGHVDEHIPPMRIDGGGSLIVDSRHKLKPNGTGNGPFTYDEDGVADPDDRYGEIDRVTVLTEIATEPFLQAVIFSGFQPGTQLWLWYQNISPTPADPDDTTYPPVTYPDNDPDIKFIGGRKPNPFKLFVKKKRLVESQSHKKNRPRRYAHTGGGVMARHFRIGQWRLINSAGATLVGASNDDNYTFYVRYADIQP